MRPGIKIIELIVTVSLMTVLFGNTAAVPDIESLDYFMDASLRKIWQNPPDRYFPAQS